MSSRLGVGVVGLVIASAALVACEKSAPTPVPISPPAMAISGAGTGAGGAKGPTGGAGGARSIAGSGGGIALGGPVACGTAMCTAPMVAAAPSAPPLAAPCCLDPAMATCGFTMKSSGTCLPPPAADPECPAGPMGQKGCCLDSGMLCGIDATMFGLPGCFNIVESLALDLGGMPVPTRCDGTPVGAANPQSGGTGGSAAGSPGSGGAGGRAAGGAGGSAAAGRGGAGGA